MVSNSKEVENCWEFWDCQVGVRNECPAYTLKAGKDCFNLATDFCPRQKVEFKHCWECHGDTGTGDGPKAKDLKDDWGRTMLPFNFTSGELKRGSSPENVYSTFTTGLDGTGMPSYEDSLKEDDRWHLVSYTLDLMRNIK